MNVMAARNEYTDACTDTYHRHLICFGDLSIFPFNITTRRKSFDRMKFLSWHWVFFFYQIVKQTVKTRQLAWLLFYALNLLDKTDLANENGVPIILEEVEEERFWYIPSPMYCITRSNPTRPNLMLPVRCKCLRAFGNVGSWHSDKPKGINSNLLSICLVEKYIWASKGLAKLYISSTPSPFNLTSKNRRLNEDNSMGQSWISRR